MRAIAFVVGLFAASCVDLSRPRAFRCEDDTGCSGGWVCLRDKFCHDPAVGADVACVTKTDCTGGWFCGQEKRCLDPLQPSDFACADDSQCARPWRCSSERRCVDLSKEPRALAFRATSSAPALESPLTTPFDLVRTTPTQRLPENGGLSLAWESALARGPTLERAVLYGSSSPEATYFLAQRSRVELPATPLDLAVVVGSLLVSLPARPMLLLQEGQGRPITPPFAVERLVPLAWNEGPDGGGAPGAGFAALGGGQAAFISLDGGLVSLAPGVIDLTATGKTNDAGAPWLLVLRAGDGGTAVYAELASGASQQLYVDLTNLAAGVGPPQRAVRLRFEGGGLAVLFEDLPPPPPAPPVPGSWVAKLVCSADGCDGGVTEGPVCPEEPDFSVLGGNTLRTSCPVPNELFNFLQDSSSVSSSEFFELRRAHRSWGTSTGHVRQTAGGQLSWSTSLDEELTDVLSERPEVFGVSMSGLYASRGHDVYEKPASPLEDGGAPLGLSLTSRLGEAAARPVAFVEGADLVLLSSGAVLRTGLGIPGFPFELEAQPSPGARARMLLAPDGGQVLVATSGDGLYAGAETSFGVSLVSQTLKPAPGFPINDWALRTADGGYLEGWAVANNRLFRVTASTVERWKSSEVPVTGRDPLGVWFSGEAVQLGTASGEVLMLPSRVSVVPPLLDGVTSMTALCGSVFATTFDSVWEVVPTDGGQGAWRELVMPPVVLPLLHRANERLFVLDQDGVVIQLPVTCP